MMRGRVYRVMRASQDGLPEVGADRFKLGAEIPRDIEPAADGTVRPQRRGMSVFDDPNALPAHLLPTHLGGDSPIPLFHFPGSWPGSLSVAQQGRNPHHHVVQPARQCPLADYQAALASTRPGWEQDR